MPCFLERDPSFPPTFLPSSFPLSHHFCFLSLFHFFRTERGAVCGGKAMDEPLEIPPQGQGIPGMSPAWCGGMWGSPLVMGEPLCPENRILFMDHFPISSCYVAWSRFRNLHSKPCPQACPRLWHWTVIKCYPLVAKWAYCQVVPLCPYKCPSGDFLLPLASVYNVQVP